MKKDFDYRRRGDYDYDSDSQNEFDTLFCSDGLHLALTRIRITPAWPYLALVCNGVSPY